MVYVTSSARHFDICPLGDYEIGKFKDGEICVKIYDDVNSKDVWVIASTESPSDNYFELFFLLSALQNGGAKIHLIITYLGYARQDKPKHNESASLQVIGSFLKQFRLQEIYIVQPHSTVLSDVIQFTPVFPTSLFLPLIKRYDLVVIPDMGARHWAIDMVQDAEKPFVTFEKYRPQPEEVMVKKITGDIKGQRCIILDDIISTGNTLIKETEFLMNEGASEVSALATHGIMVPDAPKMMQASKLKKIYITNSTTRAKGERNIEVLDLEPLISQIIKGQSR